MCQDKKSDADDKCARYASAQARDETEFKLFPKGDITFIRSWLAWTDTHAATLAHTAPIATLPPPGIGQVDGTAAMLEDEGFLFLFNPSMVGLNASLEVDESLGISNLSAAESWNVRELFPRSIDLGDWKHGQLVTVKVVSLLPSCLTSARDAASPLYAVLTARISRHGRSCTDSATAHID